MISANLDLIRTSSFSSTICYFKSEDSNLHENPMLIAVSILSPVNTHTLMPASLIAAIVLDTSYYNLSSMAVAPIISKFLSNSS